MTRLVSQLLKIAVTDRLVVDVASVADPAAACRAVVEALAPLAIRTRTDLGLAVGPVALVELLAIRGEDLFQIVRNLVDTAIDHTGLDTTIDVRVLANGATMVNDNGSGIPEELQGEMFKRFWRRNRSGNHWAGLGLAIVQRLVETHGGSVRLQSADGAGSSFTVTIPQAGSMSGREMRDIHRAAFSTGLIGLGGGSAMTARTP
ncbi:MAG: sensor histidine kinase [Janthinobacterium lividum]